MASQENQQKPERLSSYLTIYVKKLLPGFLMLAGAGFIAIHLLSIDQLIGVIPYIICPALVIAFGVHLRKGCRNILDTVLDCGDYLLIARDGLEDKIFFENILNVEDRQTKTINTGLIPSKVDNYADRGGLFFSSTITIELENPCRFGKLFSFCPRSTLFDTVAYSIFLPDALADRLAAKASAARVRKYGWSKASS